MRRVKRWRFYCDFCKKAGGSGGHIARHEKGCTLNPGRVCRVCGMISADQKPIENIIRHLPKHSDYPCVGDGPYCDLIEYSDEYQTAIEICMPELRAYVENCSACIMAALRQSGIPVPFVESFNFTDEMGAIWAVINDSSNHIDRYGY